MKKLLSMLITASMIFSTVVVSVSADVTVPDGVTPVPVSPTTAARVLAYLGDPEPAYTCASKANEITYDGESAYVANAHVKPFDVYVDASAAGKYQISVIGIRTSNGWNPAGSIYINDSATAAFTNGGIAVGIGQGTSNVNATPWGVVDLVAGVNKISFVGLNNHRIGGMVISGLGTAESKPEWVVPLEAKAGVGETAEFVEYANQVYNTKPMISRYQMYARASTYNSVGVFSNILCNGGVTFYVNAPAAGEYGLELLHSRNKNSGWPSDLAVDVNGTKIAGKTGAPTLPSASWVSEFCSWGTVTLNAGLNVIHVGLNYDTTTDANNNHGVQGIRVTGMGATGGSEGGEGGEEGGDEPTLPDGVTAADVSATTAVTIDADNAAVAGTKVAKLGVNTVVANASTSFYLNAATAGTYFVKLYGAGAQGWTDVPLTVNGTELMARRLFPGSNVGVAFQDSENVYPVTLVEGVNVISFKQVDNNNFVRSMTVMGADSDVSVPSISTTGGKVKYAFQAEKAGAELAYVQRSDGYKHFDVFVNAEVAGDYYFTTYTQVRFNAAAKTVTVYVNDTNAQTLTHDTGYDYNYDTAYNSKPRRFRAHTFKVTLNKGLNVIAAVPNHNEIAVDKFEIRNYEVSGTTNVGSVANGIYGAAFETTTTVASSPKVVTKSLVYDSIPTGASTIDVSAWVACATDKVNPTLIVASYDSNDRLIDAKISTFYGAAGTLVDAKATGLDVDGAETVKIIELDGLTNLYNIATVSL